MKTLALTILLSLTGLVVKSQDRITYAVTCQAYKLNKQSIAEGKHIDSLKSVGYKVVSVFRIDPKLNKSFPNHVALVFVRAKK